MTSGTGPAPGAWACRCGRRVPSGVGTCRCGGKRGEAPSSSAPARAPARAEAAEERSYAWVGKVLALVAVVAVYFGSRGCNRYLASREARGAALSALTEVMGPEEARAVVDEHHAACFAEHYKTGWGKRSRSTFDTEKYARCIIRRAESEIVELKLEAARASRRRPTPASASRPASRPPPRPVGSPGPTQAPTPQAQPADGGPVVLGDIRLLGFRREPQLMVRVTFVAVGRTGALQESAHCSYAVECDGQALGVPAGQRMVAGCSLKVDGAKGEGLLHFLLAERGPSEGACRLDLALSDGARLRSNQVVVPLT